MNGKLDNIYRLRCLRVAIARKLYKTIGNINMCRESELLEVKALIGFLARVSVSLCRDGHYLYITCKLYLGNVVKM